jgi:hypothetical protein
MDRFEMAIALIERARDESIRLMTFDRALDEARATPGYTWKDRCKIEEQFSPLPHKSVVNDCLKMARRLLKEAYI